MGHTHTTTTKYWEPTNTALIDNSQCQKSQLPSEKTQTHRMDLKTGSILLLYLRKTPQHQGQTQPRGKRMEKCTPSSGTQEASWCNHFNIWWNRLQRKANQGRLLVVRRGGRHYILIKGNIWENIAILTIYELNKRAPKYMCVCVHTVQKHYNYIIYVIIWYM